MGEAKRMNKVAAGGSFVTHDLEVYITEERRNSYMFKLDFGLKKSRKNI
jgi:hypothetical protein